MKKEKIVSALERAGRGESRLFDDALAARRKAFGDSVWVRGVIEVTNACECSCRYCEMSAANASLGRYALGGEQIIDAAQQAKKSGVRTLLLQGGQNGSVAALMDEVLPQLHGMGFYVILCLGNKSRQEYQRMFDAGADAYILKFETSDAALFRALRGSELQERLGCLDTLIDIGYDVGTGNIVGLPGQTVDQLADDIMLVGKLSKRLAMVSASPFIPSKNTPLGGNSPGSLDLTLKAMALMRLAGPALSIPSVSALKLLAEDGQVRGLQAGATNITVNFTPDSVRDSYRIYDSRRFTVGLEYALETIRRAGFNPVFEHSSRS